MQCSASDSVGLIFTRSHRSTPLIMIPTVTPAVVKTSLKGRSRKHFATLIFFPLEVDELLMLDE